MHNKTIKELSALLHSKQVSATELTRTTSTASRERPQRLPARRPELSLAQAAPPTRASPTATPAR
jgi:aspartyl-tRNA(Asn)/glutamyl-tRNA(Gln) amidotransferase subunit A